MLVKACQTSSLLLFKFWQGLYLLMSSYNLIYTMNFTMKYDIVPFSHILVHSKFRIFGLAEAQILSEPNLISTNERRDNIRPMRNGYYFPISGSHLRPAVYLGEFSFPLPKNGHEAAICRCGTLLSWPSMLEAALDPPCWVHPVLQGDANDQGEDPGAKLHLAELEG